MKTFATVCALILFAMGCASNRTHEETFTSLRSLIEQRLGDSCDCGPITTNALMGGSLFEVQPKPRGVQVTVSERPFFSQTKWEKLYASRMNSIFDFEEMTTNYSAEAIHVVDLKTTPVTGVTNAFGLLVLPNWHYQNIGVDVNVQEVDLSYPGLDQDEAKARKCYSQIVTLLKPYHRAGPHSN